MTYKLYRILDDASITEVSQHGDIAEGVQAGKHMVEVECFDYAYSLHTDDGCKVATFAEGRVGYREWARRSGRLDTIHAQDDRYDHDVDELLVR